MSNITVSYKLTISPNEAVNGTKKLLTRKGKRLEVTIPAGVKTGSLVKLSSALQITDGYYGDILIQIKVKSRRRGVLATAIIAGLSIIIISSIINSGGTTEPTAPSPSDFITDFHNKQPLSLMTSTGESICLVNNNNATDPTWRQLEVFLRIDKTDQHQYLLGSYTCGDFAEEVHNNAEVAGIRAAFVAVFFESESKGHALNAFETTDSGLVYIDCLEHDTIAYIEEGKKYGNIAIAKAKSLSYRFYEEYARKWQEHETKLEAYKREVEQYNQKIRGEVYYEGSPELASIEAWEERLEQESHELDELSEELGDFWFEPLGIVESVEIYW